MMRGMQASNALAGQRATKKRAQDDVKLLANRIALLKLEEKKVSTILYILNSKLDFILSHIDTVKLALQSI